MAAGAEASNTIISEETAGILHPQSVITPDQLKLFRDLDEDFSNFRKQLRIVKQKLPLHLDPLLFVERSGPISPDDKCKDRSSETKQVKHPMSQSLASKLGLSSDEERKHTEFTFVVPALNFYNKQNATNFKLLDTTHSRLFYFKGVWAHCVFKAALLNSSYPKFFFAEVLRHDHDGTQEFEVKTVGILYDTNYYKCPACDGLNIPHPWNFVSQAYSST